MHSMLLQTIDFRQACLGSPCVVCGCCNLCDRVILPPHLPDLCACPDLSVHSYCILCAPTSETTQ